MVTYWCVWCGETTERRTPREAPQCTRCITEFQLAFGFPLRTLMVPLDGSRTLEEHGSLRKRFIFTAPTGEHVWTTSVHASRGDTSDLEDQDFLIDHGVFTIYDIGA